MCKCTSVFAQTGQKYLEIHFSMQFAHDMHRQK